MPLFESVDCLQSGADVLRRRRYGVIEMADEQLVAVHLRPWPKSVSLLEIAWLGRRMHRYRPGNRCLLYYNQPLRFPNFLVLKYVVSQLGTSLKTFRGSMAILDEIARIKQSDAALTEVSNLRISDRLLRRGGWERHVLQSRRRHYIRRFYGEYPVWPPNSSSAANLSAGAPASKAGGLAEAANLR